MYTHRVSEARWKDQLWSIIICSLERDQSWAWPAAPSDAERWQCSRGPKPWDLWWPRAEVLSCWYVTNALCLSAAFKNRDSTFLVASDDTRSTSLTCWGWWKHLVNKLLVFRNVVPAVPQVYTSMFLWRRAMAWDYRSTHRTASTVRPVISKTPARTSTGLCLRAVVDQPTMACDFSITYHFYYWAQVQNRFT